eukprot:2620932-Rhodomonas_salina.4
MSDQMRAGVSTGHADSEIRGVIGQYLGMPLLGQIGTYLLELVQRQSRHHRTTPAPSTPKARQTPERNPEP